MTALPPLDVRTARREARRELHSEGSTQRILFISLLLALALGAVLLLNVWTGEAEVERILTPAVVARTLAHHLPLLHISLPASVPYADAILWQERMPRAISGALIGMLLAAVGVAFQSLLRNPLADPYTMGIAGGSALGSLGITIAGGAAWLGGYAPTFCAFFAGLLAVGLVMKIAKIGGRLSLTALLLAGVTVGAFFWSLIPLIITLGAHAGADRQARIMAALFGSLQTMDWQHVGFLLPFGLLGGILLWTSAPELDLMAFGEETAAHLGVDSERLKWKVTIAGALMTAAAVSTAGIIAFVGFVTPHAARRLVGPGHRGLLPVAMLLGALLLTLSDWLARVFLGDVQVGVVTSLFGVPLFALLLRSKLRSM